MAWVRRRADVTGTRNCCAFSDVTIRISELAITLGPHGSSTALRPRSEWVVRQPSGSFHKLFKLGPLGRKTDPGETQEDEAKDWCRIFPRLQAGVGAELVGSIPETLFKRGAIRVFFGRGDAGCDGASSNRAGFGSTVLSPWGKYR